MIELEAGKLKIKVYGNRDLLGAAAAKMVAGKINELHSVQPFVNIIFAAAASQNEFLAFLIKEKVDWQRVNAFHMDEYIGLDKEAPQQFGPWLKQRIFSKLPFHKVFYIDGQAGDPEAECLRYSDLLMQYPVDITCMGIGENTHLAFNDPHVADFQDPKMVKIVDLDEACKMQQVSEGCFANTSQVPVEAFTLTIPALLKANHIYCMVPGDRKAKAVNYTLTGSINEQYPSTILRTHRDAVLFLDTESSSLALAERVMK